MKTAIIWRESIYLNDFKCNCGKQLMKDNKINDDVLFDERREMFICPECHRDVAKLTTQEYAVKIKAMREGVH